MARSGFRKTMGDAGGWVASQARGLWSWAKKHPILATMLVAGIVAAAAFPPLYALLPALPVVGPAVLSLIASAPYWAAPIIFALSVASAAVTATFTFLVVKLFKKLFSASPDASASLDDIEVDEDYVDFEPHPPQDKGLWSWAKKHPILATTLVVGMIAAAAFPPLYALLPALPVVGPAVLSLIASAPYWAAPITFALSVASAAVTATFTFLVVKLFKNLFNSSPRGSGGAFASLDGLESRQDKPSVLDADPKDLDITSRPSASRLYQQHYASTPGDVDLSSDEQVTHADAADPSPAKKERSVSNLSVHSAQNAQLSTSPHSFHNEASSIRRARSASCPAAANVSAQEPVHHASQSSL